MGETPSADDLTGRVLGARYRIERPIKRGGMGQVYAAVDEKNDGARVAVKVVRQALLDDPQAVARFKREAKLVTGMVHENIVTSLESGDDAGLLWIAMELLEGESLRERLDARGRMQWHETLPIVEQIVRALRVAHDKGVIHRDLKPENVMLEGATGSERAKLLDFGVAKQAHVEGGTNGGTSNMTGTGLIVGTPGYVAPEVVLEGRTDDPRSDFYALGVTWFEMLTAQKPFTAKTAFALAMRHAHEPAPTPTSLVPYSPVPHPIERLVLRLMAKNPDERPQNATALLDALKNLAEESQRALANPTPAPASLTPDQPTMTSTDLGGKTPHHTDVVAFRTPLSIQQPVSSATPATSLQQAQQGTPLPADFVPQLIAQIPKKKVAAIVSAGLALFACAIVCAVVLVLKVVSPAETVAPTTANANANAPIVEAPAPPPAPTPPAPTMPAPSPAPDNAKHDDDHATQAPKHDAAKAPDKKRDDSKANEKKADDEKANAKADAKADDGKPKQDAAAPAKIVGVWLYPDRRGQEVQVSVDNGTMRNLPFVEQLAADKPHHFKFVFVKEPDTPTIEHDYTIAGTSDWKITPTQAPTPK